MGGHGGLNILPQKKWNVYNHDNRAIVQKDKKLHAQKKRNQFQKQRLHRLQQKIQVLKEQDQGQIHQKHIEKIDTLVGSELKRLQQENKHVNLFEQQEKIILNRQLLQCQKLKVEEWLKDKNMDYSSKFLGTYNNEEKLPWYLKCKQDKNNRLKDFSKLNKSDYYQMDLIVDNVQVKKHKTMRIPQKIDQIKIQIRQRSRQKKLNFLSQKQKQDSNCVRRQQSQIDDFAKTEKQLTQVKKVNFSVSNNSQSLLQLRQKRLKRQLKEKKKAQQLKKKFEIQKKLN